MYSLHDHIAADERFAALLAQANDAVFLLDRDGLCLLLNERGADLLGVEGDALVGRPLRENVPDFEQARWDDLLARLRGGQPLPLEEWLLRHADGGTVPVEMNPFSVAGPGRAQVFVLLARDLSARKQAERQLVEQVYILQQVSDAIIATDMVGTILSWNQAAEVIYGWAAEDVLGRKLHEVVPQVTLAGSDEQIKQQYMIRGHWRSELVQRRRDGSTIVVSSSVSLVRDQQGRPAGLVIVNHDISQRKEAELHMQTYANHLAALRQVDAEINSTLDIQQVLHFALNAAAGLAGADAGFILLNDEGDQPRLARTYGAYQWAEAVLQEQASPLYGVTARVMQTREPALITDVNEDPDYYRDLPETVALMAFPLVSGERLIGSITLETAQRDHFTPATFEFVKLVVNRLAAALDNARLHQLTRDQVERLARLEQLKTQMIRLASHDLRNPVGLIHGFLEVLRMDAADRLTDEEMDYIDTMARSVDRMQHIIQDLLSLERAEERARQDQGQPVALRAMAEAVHAAFHDVAAGAGLLLRLDLSELPADDPLTVTGDPSMLHEVMTNLVENAVKYTPAGGQVTLRLARNGQQASFRVQDTGIGIKPEEQPRLFEPFYRVHSLETAEISGTGLGLHLVKTIIEQHGGQVVFSSVYGQGSIFGFDLPLPTV